MFRPAVKKLSTRFAMRSIARNNINGQALFSTGGSSGLYDKVAFIGIGKMALAMLNPLIKTGLQPEEQVGIYDVSKSAVASVKHDFPNIQCAQSISELVEGADLVICAVKPQNIDEKFFAQFPRDLHENATFLSILAGTPIADFEPAGFPNVVRSMPNTPAMIGQGMTVWTCTENVSSDERKKIKQVLNTFGKSIYVDDEKVFDPLLFCLPCQLH
jgi:pyrroline-5-carboxylate reductase